MNIFILDRDPVLAAQYQCDKHIVKMPLETAQMLSTNVRLTNGNAKLIPDLVKFTKDGRSELYQIAYQNHPCTVWARESKANFLWLKDHGLALCTEYSHRYGKMHASFPIIASAMSETIPEGELTPWPLCMPDEYKSLDPVLSYKTYYIKDKNKIAFWNKNRSAPTWYMDGIIEYANVLKGAGAEKLKPGS